MGVNLHVPGVPLPAHEAVHLLLESQFLTIIIDSMNTMTTVFRKTITVIAILALMEPQVSQGVSQVRKYNKMVWRRMINVQIGKSICRRKRWRMWRR